MRAYRADPAYRQRPDVHNELERIGRRLNQPIRIALAGTLKAGKSTLVNALVGEDIAPTDATEATRIVTWFRNGPTPKVTANHRGGRRSNVPIARNGGLTFDFATLDPEDVVDLDVEWPAAELIDTTIIDTPGTSSLSRDVSERTLRLLVPEDGVPRVDAVVFLLRTLNAADIALLKQIGELVGGSAGALGVIGVASRADEIGAGRIDAMLSAKDVAKRFTSEMDKTGICQAVVPVSGLLALTARTLRQSEFVALEKLAGGRRRRTGQGDAVGRPVRPRGQRAAGRRRRPARRCWTGSACSVCGSPSRCCGPASPTRWGWPTSCSSAAAWSRCATSSTSSSRSARICSRRTRRCCRCASSSQNNPIYATPHILADIDPLLADTHAFEELRLLSQLRSRATTLNEDEMASLRRIIGGSGTDAASRLGLQPDDPYDGPRAAFAAAQRWRRRADHPLNDPFTTRACRAAVRSAEAMVAEYAAQRPLGRYRAGNRDLRDLRDLWDLRVARRR